MLQPSTCQVPKHAQEHVQYDQGEDRCNSIAFTLTAAVERHLHLSSVARWLCTLMLQQGWRVEYSAASDSFTGDPPHPHHAHYPSLP